jgi:hypothetical protein
MKMSRYGLTVQGVKLSSGAGVTYFWLAAARFPVARSALFQTEIIYRNNQNIL